VNIHLVTSAATRRRAFTLLEVMIAVSLFFMATFSVLALVSRSVAQARNLKPVSIDPSAVAAELSLTNRLEEGPIPPEYITSFEHMYPGYTCTGFITEIATNGFFRVDLKVGGVGASGRAVTSESSILLHRPLSPPPRR
jgi:Tfp pilus assembly protein PilV